MIHWQSSPRIACSNKHLDDTAADTSREDTSGRVLTRCTNQRDPHISLTVLVRWACCEQQLDGESAALLRMSLLTPCSLNPSLSSLKSYALEQGGTFLYVATLLSPISTHSHPGEGSAADAELGPWSRLALIAAGMLVPALLAGLVGHGH